MKYIDAAVRGFLGACLLFATALLFTNVALRYFWKSSIFWAEEMLRYLIVWITFIGASTCVREESHISIDVLSNMLNDKGKRILKLTLNVAGLLFGAWFLTVSFSCLRQVKSSGQVSATIGNVPMYVIYLCFPIGFLLYVLQSADRVFKLLRQAERGETQ